MKCVIIDDEPLAIDVIESYLEQIGDVDIVAKCTNSLEAIRIISQNEIDLIFLDIEMPNLNGLDLVKTLEKLPQFIFTTAYPQYALDGFNLNATDYLVKPIPFHRFIKALARAREKYESLKHKTPDLITQPKVVQTNNKPAQNFIFVKSEYENIKINTNEIVYLQGLKDYIKIFTNTKTSSILTLSSFKEILEKLPENKFIRVHRSYVVNIDYITALQKSKIIIQDLRIPIGETYKNEVLTQLGV